jgi:hypothetical protein
MLVRPTERPFYEQASIAYTAQTGISVELRTLDAVNLVNQVRGNALMGFNLTMNILDVSAEST